MNRYQVTVYTFEPRRGARPSDELLVLARSQAEASSIAMGRFGRFPWVQLDTRDAPLT